MTRIIRDLGASIAVGLILSPILGLAIGSVAEVGPLEEFRASVVRWGLTLSDPMVLACLWNSLAVSIGAVGLGSVVGVAMARIIRSRGGWRRGVDLLLVRLAAGCHPFFSAIGYLMLAPVLSGLRFGGPDAVDLGVGEPWRWVGLVLSQFGFSSAWVAWWTVRGLDRIQGDRVLVSMLSGASRGWIWRSSSWPLIRPTVSRAAASAFAVVLIEPGAPIVLGLGRTLGAQIVASSWMSTRDDWPRAVVLAALGLVVSALVRLVLTRWGGRDELGEPMPDHSRSADLPGSGGRLLGVTSAMLMGAWLLLCLCPALAVFGAAGGALDDRTVVGGADRLALAAGSSVALGVTATSLAMLMAWPISAGRWTRGVSAIVEAMPPLGIGLGLLGMVELLRALSGSLASDSILVAVIRAIDPYRTPWLLVSWGTAVAHLPWAVEASRRARQVDAGALQDLARLSGDRRARSRTLLLAPIGLRKHARTALGVAMLSASGLSPAIVLAPMEAFRPVGAWILREPGLGAEAIPILAASGLACQMIGVLLLLGPARQWETVSVSRS